MELQDLDLIAHQAIVFSGGIDPESCLSRRVEALFPGPLRPAWLATELGARLHTALAFRAYRDGQHADVPHHIYRAVRLKPGVLKNRGIPAVLVRSLLGMLRMS